MANLNTSLYAAQSGIAGQSLNVGTPLAKNAYGKHRIVQIPYVMTGLEATNDILRLTVLKPGARVIAALSKVVGEALGTALTVSVGDASNATRYSGVLALTAVHDIAFTSVPGTDAYAPTDVAIVPGGADQTVVTAKIVLATAPTALKKVLFLLAVVDE
jgi:hypothetical protein